MTACQIEQSEHKPAPGRQVTCWFVDEQLPLRKLGFLLFLPKSYTASGQRWPLILFLHGVGQRGNLPAQVAQHGPPKLAASDPDFPFVVVAPQCPPDRTWSDPMLLPQLSLLVRTVVDTYRVDPQRLYLTGLSMGGFGALHLAAEHPELWAAVVPVCGGGSAATVDRLKTLPIWIFHGEKDTVVPPECSTRMFEALRRAGSKAQLTLYPALEHDSWTVTYDNPQLYEWLLAHRRSG